MISPFEIYLVMQLDSVRLTALLIAVFAGIAIGPVLMSASDRAFKRPVRVIGAALTIFALSVGASALLPSSRTAAAMLVIPAILNNEKIQDEAGELYQLAKQGLQRIVADEKQSEDKQ